MASRVPYSVLAIAGVALRLAAAQQPTFRSGVEYVQLDAVVTDKDDRPVAGLTQADFEIVEHGTPQTIATFQFVSIPPAHRTAPVARTATPTVDVVSNVHSPAGRQWVLVIDDLHIIELHIVHTKKVVQAFLESLPADDQVAVVFVGRSDLSQDFTSDLGAQIRTVDRIKASLGFAYDAADHGGADGIGRIAAADRHRYGVATTDVLKNVTAALARSSYSRKAIVYYSEGITYALPDDSYGYTSDVLDRWHESFDAARKAGVPIYALDPRGIPDCTAVRGDCAAGPPRGKIQTQQDHLRELAENTGGRAFVNRADTVEAVRELVADSDSFYLLGYYPSPFDRDGRFHDVRVTLKGRPDLKVRARAGYAAPKAGTPTATEAAQTLDDALGAALPVAGLQLRAAAAPVAIGEKGMTTAISLEVTYPALPAATFTDALRFGVVALDREGKIKAQTRGAYEYGATPKAGQIVSYTINAALDLPSQPLTLRLAVASQALDRVASIHVPIEVMNPNRDALQIGAIVLAFAGPPRQTAVPPDALKGLLPIQPTLARTFAASDALRIHAPLFWRGDGGTAIVTIAIRRGEATVRGTRVTVSGAPSNSRSVSRAQQAAVTGGLSLADLPPGDDYTLEIEARLSTGSIARRAVAFAIR